jgi:NitT/TauT family transport system substrate-binding protein
LLGLLLSVGQVSSASSTRSLATIQAVSTPAFGGIPIYLGVSKGWFAARGLDVNPSTLGSSPSLVAGVVSGSIQFAVVNWLTILAAYTQGLPIVVVAPGSAQRLGVSGVVVSASSSIRSAKDLEGKTYSAAAIGGSENLNFVTWMARHGGDPTKVRIVAVGLSTVLSAIQSGAVDAGYVAAPQITQALHDPANFRVIGNDDNAVVPFGTSQTAWIANADWVKNNPDAAKAFVKTITGANAYINTHPTEAKATMEATNYLGLTSAQALGTTIGSFPTALSIKTTQTIADAAYAGGFITQAVNVSKVFWSGAPVTN